MRVHTLLRALAGALAVCVLAASHGARAQSTGYEVALSGSNQAVPGESMRLAATLYEVNGLASLRTLSQGEVRATLFRYVESGQRREVVSGTFQADASGRATIELAVPAAPLGGSAVLVLVVGRRGDRNPREITVPVSVGSALRLDAVTDRQRYEPGETVHAFALLRRRLSGAPVRDARVRVVMRAPDGTALHDSVLPTRASGALYLDVPLLPSAAPGSYGVTFSYEGGGSSVSATRTVVVGQRTVERMLVTATIEQPVVAPGTRIAGRATVRTASGAPIAGASVVVSLGSARATYTSDAEGNVAFELTAPGYLSGDVESTSIDVRVEHPAYGMRREAVPVVIARSPYRVEVVAAGGALVPEVPGRVFLHVLDPLGRPAPSGMAVEVSGVGVANRRFTGAVDVDGLVEVPMLVPVGASAQVSAGPCAGSNAIALEVTLSSRRPLTVQACARVAGYAQVAIRARSAVAAPGAELAIDVSRRPAVSGQGVLVEVLHDGRVVSSTFVAGSASQATVRLPEELSGAVVLRARALGRHDSVPALSAEGAATFGAGSSDAVMVRPADAFALTLDAGDQVYAVRGTATVRARASVESPSAFFTMVARDLAQHGGEVDYAIAWLTRFYEAAVVIPSDVDHALLVRATLAASLSPDSRARGVAPVVREPWDDGDYASPGAQTHRSELRDPLRIRDELLRRTAAELMVLVEGLVQGEIALTSEEPRRYTLRGGGFPPDLVARMVEDGAMTEEQAETLGGRRMTLAMLQSADPSFTFANVAARLCRARLAKLMLSLLAFTNPDDENAARAIAGVPPSRWLSRLVELGMVQPEELKDPWGRTFVFRPAQGGVPRVVLSDRAPTYELVSAGPDGRAGSGDDVRDPFRRVLPAGSPYAVASGEDAMMKALASIAPGESTLQAMLRAYDSRSLASLDEERDSSIVAAPSEEAMDSLYEGEAPSAMGTIGYGAGGGSGSGYGRGSGSLSSRSAPSPAVRQSAATAPPPPPPPAGSTLARAGELVRERFPATLFFLGDHALGRETSVQIPLADALTTYRVEAIAWTASGFVTTAKTEFRVDQQATIDAAIPETATVGDVLRVPVRIENRGTSPLRVRIGFAAEGIQVSGGAVRVVDVPARDVLETIESLRVEAAGSGQVVVRLLRDADEAPLDAVRRPLVAYADARLVHETVRRFVEGTQTVAIPVPADATERGPGELRISTGFDFFGELGANSPAERIDRAWARLAAGIAVSDEDRTLAVSIVEGLVSTTIPPDVRPFVYIVRNDPTRLARALSVAWGHAELDADLARLALEQLSQHLPETNDRGPGAEGHYTNDAGILLALAPLARRSGLETEPAALLARLRELVANGSARSTDDIRVSVLQAAALANTRTSGDRDARADELLRRLERFVVQSGDGRFLEAEDVGRPHARELPTALLALAYLGQGDRARAFESFRGLVRRPERALVEAARVPAAVVAGVLLARADAELRVLLDGRPVELRGEGGARAATLPGLGRAGAHALRVELPSGSAALLTLEVRYGRPWDGAEARHLPVRLTQEGAVGSRDTRSGLALELLNEGARMVREPVVELDLPAGAELDEPARTALAALCRTQPTIEARTLRLALRPIAPGGRVRLPLRIRWTVGGELRGLGVTVYEDAPLAGGAVPRAILPSRLLQIADRGVEPEAAEAEVDEPEPPPPPPPPIPLLRTLTPAVEVSR